MADQMDISVLDPIPPNSNPFKYDMYNMGTRVSSNVMIMHETFNEQKAKYIIVVNTETGERLRIDFKEDSSKCSPKCEVCI